MVRAVTAVALVLAAACGSSGDDVAAPDARAADAAGTTADASLQIDGATAADAPVTIDAPLLIDAPAAIDAAPPEPDASPGTDSGEPPIEVSGLVSAPDGLLAAKPQILGLSPVPNATVIVFRIDADTGAPISAILAQAMTNAVGRYSLTLPAGVGFEPDLVLQVTTASPAVPMAVGSPGTLSAPVVRAALDVDPASEAALRAALAFVATDPATLAAFSTDELHDLVTVLRDALSQDVSLIGSTIGQTIANLDAAFAAPIARVLPQMAAGSSYLVIFSGTLPDGETCRAYDEPILAAGSEAFDVQQTAGSTPPGLTVASSGRVVGTPAFGGTFTFTVEASVSAPPPPADSQDVTLTIAPPSPLVERVSVNTSEVAGNGHSPPLTFSIIDRAPSISRSGNEVAFASSASNLVAGDANGVADVFVRDRALGTTTRVSLSTTGAEGAQESVRPAISGNGRYVVFASRANLATDDTSSTNVYDVYRHDRQTGVTRLVNKLGSAQFGGYALAPSPATNDAGNLVVWSDGSFEIFIFGLTDTGVAFSTVVIPPGDVAHPATASVLNAVVSDNGNFVAYVTNRPGPGDANMDLDVYLANRTTTPTVYTLISSVASASVDTAIGMSADGRFVAFATAAQMAPADTNTYQDIYLFDCTAPATPTWISRPLPAAVGAYLARGAAISFDGRFVAFDSPSPHFVAGDSNTMYDVFVHDTVAHTTSLVSRPNACTQGDGFAVGPSVQSNMGAITVFASSSTNLVVDDGSPGVNDVFVSE